MKVALKMRIEERIGYFTTLAKETYKEEEDNIHMTATLYLTNHTGSQR